MAVVLQVEVIALYAIDYYMKTLLRNLLNLTCPRDYINGFLNKSPLF